MKRKLFLRGSVIAFSAALVLTGCQQLQQPQKAPEDVVRDGFKKLMTVTSHEFEFTLNGDLDAPKGKTPAKVKFNVALGGSGDLKDSQDPKINLKIDGSGNADEQTYAGSAELRMNKDALYFTVPKLDTKGAEIMPKEFMDMYIGKWWKLPVPPETLKELTSSLPDGGSQQTDTPEQKKMKDLFQNAQFFKNIKFVAMEDVKGEQSYHYTAELDKDALLMYTEQSAVNQGKTMTAEDKQQMVDSMKKFDFSGNIWVGSTSGIMNQVSGDIKLISTAADTDPTGTVSVRLSLWNFDKPVAVQIPADAKDFPIDQILGGMMGAGDVTGGTSLDQGSFGGTPTDLGIPTSTTGTEATTGGTVDTGTIPTGY